MKQLLIEQSSLQLHRRVSFLIKFKRNYNKSTKTVKRKNEKCAEKNWLLGIKLVINKQNYQGPHIILHGDHAVKYSKPRTIVMYKLLVLNQSLQSLIQCLIQAC